MASSNESEACGDLIGGGSNENAVAENNAAPLPEAATAPSRSGAYRGVRFAAAAADVQQAEEEEDSWWWEVENENLTLDQVPNVTAVFTPSPEDILDKPLDSEESQSVVMDEDFDRLHRLADRIKSTINEQRERHFSESSDKSQEEPSVTVVKQNSLPESEPKEQSLDEFKDELRLKREARFAAVQKLRDEISYLRRQLNKEREISRRLRNGETVADSSEQCEVKTNSVNNQAPAEAAALSKSTSISDEDDEDPLSRSRHANIELANAQLALQMANSENITLRGELAAVMKQVDTLKEVVACCKQMLSVKEEQCNQLKERLTEIEKSFAEREMKIMSENLREEYERQLVNIRQLRQLYEERQRVAAAEYENLQRLISIKRDELAQEQEKTKTLEERNDNLQKEVDKINDELACLRDECKEHRFEKSSLQEEIGAVNTLFSQMVMGFNGKNNLDIDRLTAMLEENRTLLNDMATKECTDGATLPKLLFELVEQARVDNGKKSPACSTMPSANAVLAGNENKAVGLGNADDVGNKAGDENEYNNDDDAETGTSSQSESEESGPHADNENMASVANDKDTEAAAASTQGSFPNAEANNTDATDAAVAAGGSGPSIALHINEKVIVTSQPAKSKKHHHPHHHHHAHRKAAASSKKCSSTPSSSSAAAANAAAAAATGATLKFNDSEVIGKVTSAQEIIGNLPKVWRVLVELLSHHQIDPVQFEENGKGEDCYKSVETPNGPKAELSVSKTYLKLKDLIMEKKSLVKETNRLKTLNCHLDYRLNEQEKRLSAVSLELTKTWHLVGKMQRQHRQLHTQEQILRYQLQQKRRLLHELKDELEHCRRKWQAARAKNDESQEQWNDLRREFAQRKLEDANNSAESGYSDSGGQVSDEEPLEANASSAAEAMEPPKCCDDVNLCEASSGVASTAGGCANFRRKRLREMFEHTRKIKRMQSTSPGRDNAGTEDSNEEVVLRWNSAPPTCGWRDIPIAVGADSSYVDDEEGESPLSSPSSYSNETGAIPKSTATRCSRRPKRRSIDETDGPGKEESKDANAETPEHRAARIQRLEEQCKTLIRQVLETSDNRERLEVQLKRFQDEMSPVQYVVPLDDIINKKRFERLTRASSVPITGSLTAREEEYTRKRSERLGRLEEESRQLLSRIKRTSDRGHYLKCSLDRIRRAPLSRDGSLESNTEEELKKPEEDLKVNDDMANASTSSQAKDSLADASTSSEATNANKSPLTAEEEAYTARRAARLQRLEEESKQLLNKLSRNNQRGDTMGSKLDALHVRHGAAETAAIQSAASSPSSPKLTTEQRIENIEKISSNREQRLRILEEEGRQLINRLSETSERGTQMINRIAERELSRQNRSTSTPQRETEASGEDKNEGVSAANIENPLTLDANAEEIPVASAIMPPLKNVACTSIVSEELTDCVTITTTPSQIAVHQGAIPKTKPASQLLAARPKAARIQSIQKTNEADESLEDMVRRLQSLPFPKREEEIKDDLQQSTENKEESCPVNESEAEEVSKPAEDSAVNENND